jgi:ubiquinone/menaquinone biosynthesis C-methylase UbiE
MVSLSESYYQEIFDTLAPHYRIVDLLSFGVASRLRKRAIHKAAVQKGSVVIDMMCGSGSNVLHLLPNQNGIRYTGIDASREMIRHASANFPHTHFLRANILKPSQPAMRADHILCSYGLKCIAPNDYPAFAHTIDQHTGAKGNFAFVEFQLPKRILLRWLMNAYLHTAYKFLCWIFLGSTSPAKALLTTLENELQPEYLGKLLIEKGFEVTIEHEVDSAVVFIYGKRNSSCFAGG